LCQARLSVSEAVSQWQAENCDGVQDAAGAGQGKVDSSVKVVSKSGQEG
jgi:hypothetical protein